MAVVNALIPGLEDIVSTGDPRRCADAARRITELFVQGAANFHSEHVDLFDGVLTRLVRGTELATRAEVAERLSLVPNAPSAVVGELAREDDIRIAGPLLRRSIVLDEPLLIEIAANRGQGHLMAISGRPTLSPDLTDVIVGRGDRDVIRSTAGNAGAAFSNLGYSVLIDRARRDGVLTLKVGQRDDLSSEHLKVLLAGSIDPVRRRLFEAVKPVRQAAIKRAMAEISGVTEGIGNRPDFIDAQRTVLALHGDGYLNEGALLGFAKAHKYEESVAALSAMSGVKIATMDRLISGDRNDPVLILGKAIGLEWGTVRSLLILRLGPNRAPSPADIERTRMDFVRLMPSTAERVVNFWKTRQTF